MRIEDSDIQAGDEVVVLRHGFLVSKKLQHITIIDKVVIIDRHSEGRRPEFLYYTKYSHYTSDIFRREHIELKRNLNKLELVILGLE